MSDDYCYVCLLENEYPRSTNLAITQINGTSVCYDHIRRIGNAGILCHPAGAQTSWTPGDPV